MPGELRSTDMGIREGVTKSIRVMGFPRWWHYGLIGGAALTLATARKAFQVLPQLVRGEESWAKAFAFLGAVFLMGFICGLIVWVGRGLSRRFGLVGDALVGMAVVPVFFACCMLLFAPQMLGERLLLDGLPMFMAAVFLGLIAGAGIGYTIRRDLPLEQREEGPVLDSELAELAGLPIFPPPTRPVTPPPSPPKAAVLGGGSIPAARDGRSRMECPRCGSPKVERLPPSQISPHPGYRCEGCGLKMRAPGMLLLYLFVLAIGAGVAGLVAYLLLGEEGEGRMPEKVVWLGAVGLVCAGYALMQIARPVPRRSSLDDEAR